MKTIDLEVITEDEAIRLYHHLSNRFGWNGTFFTRQDAQDSYNDYHNKDGEMSDETWENVRMSWYWRKGLDEILTERGWDLVHTAVAEALDSDAVS